jgi:hypothetical protein
MQSKHKAKHKSKWVFGDLINTKKTGSYILEELIFLPGTSLPAESFKEIDPDTACQFIDMVDCGGHDIYSGDIVVLNITPKNNSQHTFTQIIEVGVVEWNSKKGYFVMKNDGDFGCNHQIKGCIVDRIMILGNIHNSTNALDDILYNLREKREKGDKDWFGSLLPQ